MKNAEIKFYRTIYDIPQDASFRQGLEYSSYLVSEDGEKLGLALAQLNFPECFNKTLEALGDFDRNIIYKY